MDKYKKESKFLSLILRHRPETIGIKLDENGWADVNELISAMNKHNKKINIEMLEYIVAVNNKKRFIFNDTKEKIRANQGHSVKIDLQLKEIKPKNILYHGTSLRFHKSIKQNGILKMNRNHVHLSETKETAFDVGSRHGIPIILVISAGKMHQDGFKFYLSENGVWFTEYVPIKYTTFS